MCHNGDLSMPHDFKLLTAELWFESNHWLEVLRQRHIAAGIQTTGPLWDYWIKIYITSIEDEELMTYLLCIKKYAVESILLHIEITHRSLCEMKIWIYLDVFLQDRRQGDISFKYNVYCFEIIKIIYI